MVVNMATVATVLTPNHLVISPLISIRQVAQQMRDCEIDLAAVCENGKFRGIITGKEIVLSVADSTRNPEKECAESIMITDTPRISPRADVVEAAKIMASHRSWYLPVVQNGRFLGVVTLYNLAGGSLAAAAMVLARWTDAMHQMQAEIPAGVQPKIRLQPVRANPQ